MTRRLMRSHVALSLLALAGCRDTIAPTRACEGITFSPIASLALQANAPYATTIYDTVTIAPDVSLSPDASDRPARMRSGVGLVFVSSGVLRVFNAKLPPTVIPVAFFVQGTTAGVDTLEVRTTFTTPSCPDGAVQRIPVTITP